MHKKNKKRGGYVRFLLGAILVLLASSLLFAGPVVSTMAVGDTQGVGCNNVLLLENVSSTMNSSGYAIFRLYHYDNLIYRFKIYLNETKEIHTNGSSSCMLDLRVTLLNLYDATAVVMYDSQPHYSIVGMDVEKFKKPYILAKNSR